jgi:hypothetical protein
MTSNLGTPDPGQQAGLRLLSKRVLKVKPLLGHMTNEKISKRPEPHGHIERGSIVSLARKSEGGPLGACM